MAPSAIFPPIASEDFQCGLNALSSRHISKALRYFTSAELNGYSGDECASGRWHCWMFLGEFERAWKESDAIASRGRVDPDRLWDNSPFDGKRLMLRCLHGMGDAIHFIRYARLLHSHTRSLTVETHALLVPLFSRCPYIDKVVTWEDGSSKECTEWDQQIEVMEMPRAFRTTLDTVPAKVPYLNIGNAEIERSARHLGERTRSIRVGLLWGASEWNPARSIPIANFEPLTLLRNLALFSFQRGPRMKELQALRQECEIHDTADHSTSILDTSADLMNMDLFITVDTMAAHLAGALGTKVWLLLPFEADWRWMLDRDSTPWYPTMTLFRQSTPGDWRSVVEDVVRKLHQFAAMACG